jgi:orotate phosphoribosyltransferase
MLDELMTLMAARHGHFRLESGHHGELWLDVDRLFRRPAQLRPLIAALAERLAVHQFDAVCGPLTGGAFVGYAVAQELGVEFVHATRHPRRDDRSLFPVDYAIPFTLTDIVAGKRVAVINDVINAGSSVRGAIANLHALGAIPIAIAALLTLGDGAADLAAAKKIPLVSLATTTNRIWTPAECPMCAAKTALEDLVD